MTTCDLPNPDGKALRVHISDLSAAILRISARLDDDAVLDLLQTLAFIFLEADPVDFLACRIHFLLLPLECSRGQRRIRR